MQYDEVLEMVITELTERGEEQQHSENPKVNELVLRRIELSGQIQECISHLSQDARNTLKKYHSTMDILRPPNQISLSTGSERLCLSAPGIGRDSIKRISSILYFDHARISIHQKK